MTDLLAKLVSAEAAREESADGQDEARARLAAVLGGAMAAPLAAVGTKAAAEATAKAAAGTLWLHSAWFKAALLLSAGFGAGFITHANLPPTRTASMPSSPLGTSASVFAVPIDSSVHPQTVETVDVSELKRVALPPSSTASASATALTSAKSNGTHAAADAEAERLLLETARMALRRGDKAGALALLEDHRARFPQGQLREERDGLRVSTLAQLGRTDEAQKAAARFRKDYPMSLQSAAMPDSADAAP